MSPAGFPGTFQTSSPSETETLAAAHAAELRAGDVVLLQGEMGTGKTSWVRGACAALGIAGPVTSPTFTLARRYPAHPPAPPVSHLDLHRLASLDGEDPALLADYLTADAIAFVEWPDAALAELGDRVTWRVSLDHDGGDRRRIGVSR